LHQESANNTSYSETDNFGNEDDIDEGIKHDESKKKMNMSPARIRPTEIKKVSPVIKAPVDEY
jgi:hypothetical protein